MPLNTRVIDHIRRIAPSYGIEKVSIFGSRAREDAESHSDLDLLVDVRPGTSLLDLCRFQSELEQELDIEVDVVTTKSLHPRIRDKVMRERVPVVE